MGIFSSKKKTVIGTVVSRLVEDDLLPNSPIKSTIRAIMQDGDLPEYLLDGLIQSVGARAHRMYAYGGRDYPFGLPSGEFISANIGRPELEAVLESIEGQPVNIEYNCFGPPNILHIGWLKLVRDHGYDPATNKLGVLSAAKGFDVFLDKMEVVIPASLSGTYDQFSVSQWGESTQSGYSPSRPALQYAPNLAAFASDMPLVVSPMVSEDFARVTAAWKEVQTTTTPFGNTTSSQIKTEVFQIGNSEYDDSADYFHVKYEVGGQTKYWMYRMGAGTYPALDALLDSPQQVSGEFFPFVHFRNNKAAIDPAKASPEYLASVKMAKYLGIDYDTMLASIEENPDIGAVEQAYIMFAVPADSQDPLELRYLFEFFATLYDAGLGGSGTPTAAGQASALSQLQSVRPESMITIKDTITQMSLANTGIYRRRKVGTIGPVGTCTGTFEVINRNLPQDSSQTGVWRTNLLAAKTIPSHTYRRQVQPDLYEEIQVLGLVTRYQVEGKYWTGGDGDTDTDLLMVPLDRTIAGKYQLSEREVLYARSLHFVFNSLQTVKVKWYQRGAWKTLMKVAAIALVIISLGQAIEQAIALWQAAATLSAAAWAVFSLLIERIFTGIIITELFTLFVKAVGVDLALLLAVVAAAYGIEKIIEAGGFKAAVPAAKTMLQTALGLVKGAATSVQEGLEDLLAEGSEFSKQAEEQMKLLETAQELLEGNNLLEPFVIFGESPQDYYNRTVHSGNVGTIGYDVLHNYVEMALTLPKISDTLGETFDVQ